MGITLAYQSALHALRLSRSEKSNVKAMECVAIGRPVPRFGKRWGIREFSPNRWSWQKVSVANPLHIMVAQQEDRLRMKGVVCHVCTRDLPAGSVVYLDEHTSMVSPPLLFLQMASYLSVPELVLLGYELCGHYTRNADDPAKGPVVDSLAVATTVEEIKAYLQVSTAAWQVDKARKALEYVQDNAASSVEGLLATMYSLPVEELGYGMGPLTMNDRVSLGVNPDAHSRYPDIMFSFAPVGINYDGKDHLDLDGLVQAALEYAKAEGEERDKAKLLLVEKLDKVRAKVVDDTARNRQLASQGRIVFPATKENVFERGALDSFTGDILACARSVFGADVTQYEKAIDDSSLCKERYELLTSLI